MAARSTDETAAEPKTDGATKKVVHYKGVHDVRVIEAKDWKAAGVEDQGKVEWNALNDWKVDASALSETALNYVKNVDTTSLEIVEVPAE